MIKRLLLVFVVTVSLFICPVASSRIRVDQETEKELKEARRVTASFLTRMTRSRDIGALKDLYVDDFGKRYIASGFGDIGSSVILNDNLKTQATAVDWERYYAAQVSLRYCLVLHLISTFTPDQIRSLDTNGIKGENPLVPPELFAVLDTSPFLVWDYRKDNPAAERDVKTVEEFRGLIAVLEKATALMRERFKKKAPEQSANYRSTIASINEGPAPALQVYDREMFGFPPGTHFFRALTQPQLFELLLVKTDDGMKVAFARVYPFN